MRNSGWLVLGVAALLGITLMANEKPSDAYKAAMQGIQAANMGLNAAVTAKDYATIGKHATTLKASFTTAETFWTAKKADDAIGASKAGAKGADDLAAAAKAMNDEGIATARKAISSTCMGCHTAHRERLADGTFEIK